MTLTELQKVLGDRIAIHSDMAMDSAERNKEIETSDMIARLAKQMINNADVVLRAEKMVLDKGYSATTIEKFVVPGGFKSVPLNDELVGLPEEK